MIIHVIILVWMVIRSTKYRHHRNRIFKRHEIKGSLNIILIIMILHLRNQLLYIYINIY